VGAFGPEKGGFVEPAHPASVGASRMSYPITQWMFISEAIEEPCDTGLVIAQELGSCSLIFVLLTLLLALPNLEASVCRQTSLDAAHSDYLGDVSCLERFSICDFLRSKSATCINMAQTDKKRGLSLKFVQNKFKNSRCLIIMVGTASYKCALACRWMGQACIFGETGPSSADVCDQLVRNTGTVYRYIRRRKVRFTWKAEGHSI
jgi:hypothetical protein